MAKPRNCPHCRTQIPVGHGYHFDDQDNLVCDECGKIAFPAVEAEGRQQVRPTPQVGPFTCVDE